jgi:nitric oxide reductase NorD protein
MAEGTSFDDLIRRARLVEVVGQQGWSAVREAFPGQWFDRWVNSLSQIVEAGLVQSAVLSHARGSPVIAARLGPQAALSVVPVALQLVKFAGMRAALGLLAAAPLVARRVPDVAAFSMFLSVIEDLGRQAPESVATVLDRADQIFSSLTASGFRRWALTGVRLHATDAQKRNAYFSLSEGETLRIFDQEAGTIVLGDIERRLKIFLDALWGLRPLLRGAVKRSVVKSVRRTSFDAAMIRMPESFPGFPSHQAERLFKASVAHVGAHLLFSERFALKSLKPLQVAIVSLIEDARVEQLAMRELPGLLRLWAPFHVAEAGRQQSVLPLLARLSRSLIDEGFEDDNPWVRKGRAMFLDSRSEWEDQAISRRIGGLLGNDLGQMRVQFNERTYVVQPAYRDDNLGIWDFGEPDATPSEDAETITESVRIARTEDQNRPHHRKRTEEDKAEANRAARMTAVEQDVGIPVARYPEWDYLLGGERSDWTTVLEYEPRPAPATIVDRIYHDYAEVLSQVGRLVRTARVNKPVRLRRQPEGERLDIDACIRTTIDRRAGLVPDPRVYETSALVNRDLSILVLIDISESTKDFVAGTTTSVFSLERAATALLAEAMAGSGDPFAIHAFCSNGRGDVRYVRVKDFDAPFAETDKSRLAGLRGGYSTRIGAAIRHAGSDLARQNTHRRLLLIVTDGEPSDIDVPERRYLVEDARHAVHELAHQGIDVFCVGLDSGGDSYLSRIFGRRNVVQIDRVTALPQKLPMLYFRLTH